MLSYLTTPQIVVGLEEAAISFFFTFKAKAVQNPERRWFSLQSVFIPQDGFVNLASVLFVTQTNFRQKPAK